MSQNPSFPTSDFPVKIYHNSRCSNSRGALALIRERGIEPTIVDYIAQPLDAAALTTLIEKLQLPVRDLLRSKEAVYAELQLDGPAITDADLIAAVAAHPVLLNRPIVVTPRGAALCRPPDKVLALLPA
ncbi:MAG: arsenate reductase (glutaredoxin) [Comamonas sp.]